MLDAALADADHPGLCRDFKRRIGADGADAGTGWLSAERAGALLLEGLWRALPAELVPERLVLTAPIETYRGYRAWLQRASRDLAVPELALVDEPTAAAIGAGLPPGSRVLVVDLGGGTIDLSLVVLEGGEGRAAPIAQLLRFAGRDLPRSGQALRCARVIGKAGLALGGRDMDRWIAAHLCPEIPAEGALLGLAERMKCSLSDAAEARQILATPAGLRELRLTREALEGLLEERGLLRQLDGLLETVLAAARREGLALADIDAVLPVGGSSRIPLIRRWLQGRCPGVPLRGERPVEAVAMGALALTPGRAGARRAGAGGVPALLGPAQRAPSLAPPLPGRSELAHRTAPGAGAGLQPGGTGPARTGAGGAPAPGAGRGGLRGGSAGAARATGGSGSGAALVHPARADPPGHARTAGRRPAAAAVPHRRGGPAACGDPGSGGSR